jgi:hypothetical protein
MNFFPNPGPSSYCCERAEHALDAASYGTRDVDNLAFLVADLCHVAQRNRWDIAEILDRGVSYYGLECVTDVAEHAHEWDGGQWFPRTRVRAVLRSSRMRASAAASGAWRCPASASNAAACTWSRQR